MSMTTLPVNNFDEHLARFLASKKSPPSVSKPCTNKKFTFKKGLSLGRSNRLNSQNNEDKSKADQNNENETKAGQSNEDKSKAEISTNRCDVMPVENGCHELGLSSTKQFSFKSSVQSVSNGNRPTSVPTFANYHTKNEFNSSQQLPFKSNFPKAVSSNNDKQKERPDIRKYFSFNESNENQDQRNIAPGVSDGRTSKSYPAQPPVSDSVTEIKENIVPKFGNFKTSEKLVKEIIPEKTSNFTTPKISEKKLSPVCIPEYQNNNEQKAVTKESSESLKVKQLNYKIMTKICNIIETQDDILMKNANLKDLIILRKKILQRNSLDKSGTHNSKTSLNTSNISDYSDNLDDDDDFLITKDSKKVNSSQVLNSSLSADKTSPRQFSSALAENAKTIQNDNVQSTSKVTSLSSFKSDSSPVNSSSVFKGNSFSNNGLLKDNSSLFANKTSLRQYSSSLAENASCVNNESFKTIQNDNVQSTSKVTSLSSFQSESSPVNSSSVFKGNSFSNSGLLKDNSFDKSSFVNKQIDNTIDILDDDDLEDEDEIFSEMYDKPGTSYEVHKVNKSAEKIIAGKFYGNQRDDGASSQFKGFHFPFSKDLLQTFQNVFGLKQFRHNQLETINAALLGEDCFVLMPTGGGKSLCYQLPALVSSGVTVVISPLRSLILDQVQKLCSLDIPATSLTGDTDASTANFVYSEMFSRTPSIKLLYVTPEKISASARLMSSMENLYSQGLLQRFVIDEAHCVSQWGHDFRPDYKRLKVLREKFPKVPLMALTATATQRVRGDILHQLGMTSPKWFLQSFNRPNLKYEVRPKNKNVIQEIIELLKTKFRNMCGIIYCLSRNDCDNVANVLQKSGIRAVSYHAGVTNRDEIQEHWINDRFKVICATIAFGMGIDKPDVRFVIHHAIPKSIEGYYQESGRAGRDGENSWCILYYNYKDMQRIKRMVTQDQANKHSWTTHFDNLFKMVHYCENKTDCRRVWMLGYFGEIFDKTLCLNNPATSCDNCYSKEVFEQCDLTEDAKAIVRCVDKLVNKQKRKNFTLTYFVDIYKGAKTAKVLAAGHDKLELYGKGQALKRTDAERLLRKLVLDQYLQEDMVINKMDLPITYIYLGKRAKDLLAGKARVTMPFQKGKDKLPLATVAPTEDKEIQELIERCYNELIEVSKVIASERHLHYTNVINVEALRQMSREMPMSEEDMLTIPHVTHAVFEKYGKRFLEVTQRYAAERCVIDAEKADQAVLNACAEDIDNWSDVEASTSKGPAKRGRKRKASKAAAGVASKKQKNYFGKKFQKSKSTFANKKKILSQKKAAVRVPGFMPTPKAFGKSGARSFLPAPKVVLM